MAKVSERQPFLYPGFAEYFQNRGISVSQEGRKTGFGNPAGLGDIFFPLGREVHGIGVEHIVPPGVFEVPDAVPQIAMVGYADEIPEFKFVHSGLFLHLPQRCHFDIFSILLMPLGKVPEAAPLDQQEIPAPVAHQSAGGIHLLELRAETVIDLVGVGGWDVDAAELLTALEHQHQGMDVDFFSEVEFHGIRIGKCLVFRFADDDTAFFEVYPVHIKIAIFAMQK